MGSFMTRLSTIASMQCIARACNDFINANITVLQQSTSNNSTTLKP